MNEADTCRANGWGVGTVLEGDEGYGPTRIQLTAIGESRILAKCVSHNGEPTPQHGETSWVLWCRDWKEITPVATPTGRDEQWSNGALPHREETLVGVAYWTVRADTVYVRNTLKWRRTGREGGE